MYKKRGICKWIQIMVGKAEKPKRKEENHITCQTFRGCMPNIAFTSSKSAAGFGLQPFT